MHVCHIGYSYFPGTGLTIFYEFARHQANQGISVSVVAPGRPDEPEYEILEGVSIYRIPTPSLGRLSKARLKFLWEAAKIIRRLPIDLIHTYAFVGAGLLPWLVLRRKILWLYDCQTSAIKPPLLKLQNWLIRLESYSFDAVTVLSEGIKDIVFGHRRKVDAIVPLGADLEHFSPRAPDPDLMASLGISAQDCVLTYCGTLDHNRRMDQLLYAFAYSASRESRSKLLMVGGGSALNELKALAAELKLEDRIIFTDYVPYAEVPSYLAVTQIALAYIPIDPCFEHQPPTKTAEYLAQGLPVIATDTNGNRTFVQHLQNGVLTGDEPEVYGLAMLELIQNDSKRNNMASTARASIEAFDWGTIVRTKVLPIYQGILRANRVASQE